MKILEMTASFGCLDRETLRLEDGVNLLCLPNERGKSTWSAFLLAMFYGVDSGERAGKGRLPVKTRYQPWNGAPMEGTVTLEHQGKRLVLQRTSERGRPMGSFRAYDPDTGLDVPELTGENCGKTLLGVERSVFQRTAFLSGQDLAVTQDQALARQLSNLASSGTETDSYPAAEARLKGWKNRCRHNKTGLLPEAELRLRQIQGTLEAAENLRRQRLDVFQELEALRAEIGTLTRQERLDWESRRSEAQAALEQAERQAGDLAARTAALPETGALLALQARLDQTGMPGETAAPPCPPALEGLEAEAVLSKVQRDSQTYDQLTARAGRSTRIYWLAGILLVLGAAASLLLRQAFPGVCLLVLAAAALGGWAVQRRYNRRVGKNLDEAQAILKQYGAETRDELLRSSVAWRDYLQTRTRNQRQARETALLIQEAAAFAPEAKDLAAARAAVRAALDLRHRAQEAQSALEQARLQWQSVAGSEPALQPELRERQLRCAELRTQAAALEQQEQALGGWERLDARRQALETEIAEWKRREAAMALAQEALTAAESRMAQVYGPQLTGLAGEYLQKLTRWRYDGLVLQQDFTLQAREAAAGLTRPLAALSRGTQDQTWLALRLAMTRLLLPEHAPLVLDDALLTFDPDRTQAALDLLAQADRQVLVFTCRALTGRP